MSKLLLIDCYSLLFRAFFLVAAVLDFSAGEPTGALYGFARNGHDAARRA